MRNEYGKRLAKHLKTVLKIMVSSVPMGNAFDTLAELEKAIHPFGYVQSAAKTLTNGIKKNKVRFFLWSIFMKICMQVPILYRNTYIKSEKSPRMATLIYKHSANPGRTYLRAHYTIVHKGRKDDARFSSLVDCMTI